ncbi:MAG: VCBS repeat-containing protein, partial [Proteobacteria bacterium]|nr:VCBS repeat-containing protein [Pseudomonadota bacterium]
GDGLPEIITGGFGRVEYWTNEGGLTWSGPEPLIANPQPGLIWTTTAFGDIDGDGRLDALLPVQMLIVDEAPGAEHPVLLRRADGGWNHALDLRVGVDGSDSIASTLSDIDRDGDADILLLKDQGSGSGLFRNDGVDGSGVPVLVDAAAELGWDVYWNAMGMDSSDLNQDGLLDWCVSDNGPPVCLFSSPNGWFEAGAAHGLVPEQPVGALGSLGWSIEFVDLDNDGHVEIFQASGVSDDLTDRFPDLLFKGGPDAQFEDVSEEWGVD